MTDSSEIALEPELSQTTSPELGPMSHDTGALATYSNSAAGTCDTGTV